MRQLSSTTRKILAVAQWHMLSSWDKEILKRIENTEKLDEETIKNLSFLIDNVIQNFKTKQAFS